MNHRNPTTVLLLKIFRKFLDYYGPRHWWPAKTRFEMMVGAILTQNVSWDNAQKAVNSLKNAGLLSPAAICSASQQTIADQIKSSRFYNQKARNVKALSSFIMCQYEGSLNKMFGSQSGISREQLLKIKGIGKETADCILLYAGGRPSFVSDAYTFRFLSRWGLGRGAKTYDEIRNFFMKNLPEDVYLFNEFHALIDRHGNMTCQSKPKCGGCPVKVMEGRSGCRYAKHNG